MNKTGKKILTIGRVSRPTDFHDSSLLNFDYNPVDDWATAVVSTPNQRDQPEIWRIQMSGILEVRIESLGSGERVGLRTPPEIYDIYEDADCNCARRWTERLSTLGLPNACVHVIVFASSILRGWGETQELEGMRVVCREVAIQHANDQAYVGFTRPRIVGSE